jgi:archaea-specific RecJ-like exonuclease
MGAQQMALMIESETLTRLLPRLKLAAELISETIRDKTPLLIRHHADCDGYAGAVALERAVLSVMDKVHKRESDVHYYYKRLPSKTPFYDLTDATKDISGFLTDSARFQRRTPLVIIMDNGSCTEDLLGLKMLKLYGAKVIVIDHHPPNKENDEYIQVHVNPMLFEGNSGVTAGMIGSELAHMIDSADHTMLAALAGISDKSREPELTRYIDACAGKGTDATELQNLVEALDFELTYIGFLESRYLVNDLFLGDIELVRSFVRFITPEIKQKKARQTASIDHFMKLTEMSGKTIVRLDLSKATRQNTYPSAGKTTGMMFDLVCSRGRTPVVAMGYGNDFVTLRISRELSYDVNKIISHLATKIPYAQVDGGGHPTAGTMRFVSAALPEILKELEEYFK